MVDAQTNRSSSDLIKPPSLKPGDVVATISLSSGFAGAVPHRYAAGKTQLEQTFGLRVVEAPNSQRDADFIYRNPQARVDDLHWALTNDDVAGIVSNIGGSESVRLLPLLDFDLISRHPKVFMGFSDTTVQLMAHLHAGVVAFHGPSLLTDLAENCGIHPYTEDAIRRVLFSAEPAGRMTPSPEWTEHYLDWGDPENQSKRRIFAPNPGWTWVQGEGPAMTGPLIGGCVEVLEFLKGTEWWPSADRWKGAVLYLETSEQVPSPSRVEYWLRNYGSQGILASVSAILLGRPYQYPLVTKLQLFDAAQKVLAEFDREDLPVVADLDFGHTSPQFVLPNGCSVRVDPSRETIELVEAAVV
jgi:muramoyltetrapeptide carboxypeptidase LdcA involved in peptidoglycan recycling